MTKTLEYILYSFYVLNEKYSYGQATSQTKRYMTAIFFVYLLIFVFLGMSILGRLFVTGTLNLSLNIHLIFIIIAFAFIALGITTFFLLVLIRRKITTDYIEAVCKKYKNSISTKKAMLFLYSFSFLPVLLIFCSFKILTAISPYLN